MPNFRMVCLRLVGSSWDRQQLIAGGSDITRLVVPCLVLCDMVLYMESNHVALGSNNVPLGYNHVPLGYNHVPLGWMPKALWNTLLKCTFSTSVSGLARVSHTASALTMSFSNLKHSATSCTSGRLNSEWQIAWGVVCSSANNTRASVLLKSTMIAVCFLRF